ncbi:hypothetical protein D915_005667 [Fasciola hepatica]|uniref:Uncharacterized protein n=1 Tax=Fasciola hepatica TaxID=6192 RepID=A0A4E0R6H7_FASHE|nr:hypothetical protein D915_005667 [Fasciola hepatica]
MKCYKTTNTDGLPKRSESNQKAKSHVGKRSHGQSQQKPQMVIQQTGVDGYYMPSGANEGMGKPVVSSTTQHYKPVIASKTPASPPIPVWNGNYTNGLYPPPASIPHREWV